MTYNTDTLMIGLVLLLLFGSVALYLYIQNQQVEQKVNLLEGILLDLKMSNEFKSFSEVPAMNHVEEEEHSHIVAKTDLKEYEPFDDEVPHSVVHDADSSPKHSSTKSNSTNGSLHLDAEPLDAEVLDDLPVEDVPVVKYEDMTLKELQALAKSKGIAGSKKPQLIEALKALDQVKPGSNVMSANSFVENSATFSNGTQ